MRIKKIIEDRKGDGGIMVKDIMAANITVVTALYGKKCVGPYFQWICHNVSLMDTDIAYSFLGLQSFIEVHSSEFYCKEGVSTRRRWS
jgi:hypothetical protein